MFSLYESKMHLHLLKKKTTDSMFHLMLYIRLKLIKSTIEVFFKFAKKNTKFRFLLKTKIFFDFNYIINPYFISRKFVYLLCLIKKQLCSLQNPFAMFEVLCKLYTSVVLTYIFSVLLTF